MRQPSPVPSPSGPLRDYPGAAAYLSISVRTLKALVAARELTIVRVSARRVAFSLADLDAYIAQKREAR